MSCQSRAQTTSLQFFSPESVGRHTLRLYAVFDSVHGMDCAVDVPVHCSEEPPPDSESEDGEDDG
jgi:hypothetical protein